MRITDEVRMYARQLAGGRCECQGDGCRHHLSGARCKRGLRGDQWKVYWHSEAGGMTRANIDAWCLDCFDNNFTVPTSSVTIVSTDVGGLDADDVDQRKAITARAVLRDVADRVATENRGRLLNIEAVDIRLEFARADQAVAAARVLHEKFQEAALKLRLPTPDLCSGLHQGEVTRSRDGDLFGEAPSHASLVRAVATTGQIVVSGSVVDELGSRAEVDDLGESIVANCSAVLSCWALRT